MPHRLEVGAVWEVTQPTGLAGHSNYDGHLSAHVLPQGEKVILVEIPIFQPQNIQYVKVLDTQGLKISISISAFFWGAHPCESS
jgi:hypothetical protein